MTHTFKFSSARRPAGFTLIELLVVISILGILAAMVIGGLGAAKKKQYINNASAEMLQITGALDQYKAKYGFYPRNATNALLNPLYYELNGVNLTNISGFPTFVLLDGSASIKQSDYATAYTSGGVGNCTRGSGEDVSSAVNFISSTKPLKFAAVTTNGVTINALITSSLGPESTNEPVGVFEVNPFRYICPGINNPNSYDLWIQLVINHRTYLICNWKSGVEVNNPLP